MQNNYQAIINNPNTFVGSLIEFYKNYLNFAGKSQRINYWYTTIWYLMIFYILEIILVPTMNQQRNQSNIPFLYQNFKVISWIELIILLFAIGLPHISLTCRRFRDAGMKWYSYIIMLVIKVLFELRLFDLLETNGSTVENFVSKITGKIPADLIFFGNPVLFKNDAVESTMPLQSVIPLAILLLVIIILINVAILVIVIKPGKINNNKRQKSCNNVNLNP